MRERAGLSAAHRFMMALGTCPGAFTTDPPQIDGSEALDIARDVFGISGTLTKLSSERDANFHIVTDTGPGFVLKLSNAAEDPAITSLQTGALRHIESQAPALPVPRVLPSGAGQDETSLTIAAGTRHVVRMLTFLPGEPLHRVGPSLPQAANLGRCLAAIGIALSGFHHPAADHDLLWDLKRAVRLRPLLPAVAPGYRTLVTAALDRFEGHVVPRLAVLPRQVVHNDLNPHNVLVDAAVPARITGVLDFGDVVDTHRINDVAVAAAYQVGCPDRLDQIAAFVGGYHAISRLMPEEIEVLPDLIAMRQAMTLLIAGWRAELYPDNRAYILRNTPRAAAALEHLDTIGRQAVLERLHRACERERHL